MACLIMWGRTSTFAITFSPITGLISGLIACMVSTQIRSGMIDITTASNSWSPLTGDCISLRMSATSIVVFTFLVSNKKKLVVIDAVDQADPAGNAMPESTDLSTDAEAALGTDEKHGRVIEENIAAQELKPIEEKFVAEETLAMEEVRSQKRLAWIYGRW